MNFLSSIPPLAPRPSRRLVRAAFPFAISLACAGLGPLGRERAGQRHAPPSMTAAGAAARPASTDPDRPRVEAARSAAQPAP
jgi:hypothetical protein